MRYPPDTANCQQNIQEQVTFMVLIYLISMYANVVSSKIDLSKVKSDQLQHTSPQPDEIFAKV